MTKSESTAPEAVCTCMMGVEADDPCPVHAPDCGGYDAKASFNMDEAHVSAMTGSLALASDALRHNALIAARIIVLCPELNEGGKLGKVVAESAAGLRSLGGLMLKLYGVSAVETESAK